MKNYSTSPTDQNAVELLKSDPLRRNHAVLRFLQLISSIDDSCSIALNGEWGSGKTIFIKQIKLILDYNNPQSLLSDDLRKFMDSMGTQIPDCVNCSTVYYDAWTNDDNDDPILSLVYATIASKQSNYSSETERSLSDLVGKILDAVTARPISDVFKQVKGENSFAPVKKQENIHSLIHEFLDELILERGNRLVIFIDELDRCRPAYAVQLLERIKHYFDDERVTFVFSVNFAQLQHTIKSYYGHFFDATRYLDKFFDLRISLPEIDYRRFIEYKFSFFTSGYIYDEVCVRVAQYFSFTLREVERYMRLIRIAAYKNSHGRDEASFSGQKALQFGLLYLVPVMIGLSMSDMDAYTKFIAGENFDVLRKVLSCMTDYTYQDWLGINKKDFTNADAAVMEKIKKVYDAVFANQGNENRINPGIHIGTMTFTEQTRREIMNIATLLAPCAEYDFS